MPFDILNLLQTLLLPLAIGTVVVTALLVWLIGRQPTQRQRPPAGPPQPHTPPSLHPRQQALPEADAPGWQAPPAIAPLPDMPAHTAHPAHPAHPASASAAPPPTSTASTPPAARPRKADLLLVDDSAVVRTRLRRLFQPAGYSLALAADGEAALTLLAEGRYGLMITDLEMPRLDGVGLIRAVMADPVHAGMPMLAITGHDDLQAQLNQLHAAAGIYRKPWVDDDLLGHVQSLVAPSLLAETATEDA